MPRPPKGPIYSLLRKHLDKFRSWAKHHPADNEARQVLELLDKIRKRDWEEMRDILYGSDSSGETTWASEVSRLLDATLEYKETSKASLLK